MAIKNYFGDKIAFEYAFESFYTCWIILPATVGVLVTFYEGYKLDENGEPNTLWSFFYSAVMAIWISIFIERWKMKQNELKLKFGTLINYQTLNDIRP
jgi:surface polysaccharide O-acyltransferase-like enzyme